MIFIYVCCGGIIGAISRYLVTIQFTKYAPKVNSYVSTLIVNGIGSLLLGVVIGLKDSFTYDNLLTGISAGIIGSFTTYSTFALDCMKLIRQKRWVESIVYISITSILVISLFSIGYYLL